MSGDGVTAARSGPQNGAAGAPQPSHMIPCACHCAACRAAGHGDGACVVLCAGLHTLLAGKADVVDLVLRHYYGACGWGTARFDAEIQCVQYGPGLGDVIAAGASYGRIHFICAQTGEKILRPLNVDAGKYGVQSVSFSPKGDMVAAGCYSGKIFLVDAAAGEIKSSLRGHGNTVSSLAFKPDDPNVLVTGSWDKTVKLWDLSTSTCLSTMRCDSEVRSVAYSADGTKLAAGLAFPGNSVVVFNTQTNEQICSLNVDGKVESVHWSPCGTKIAAACNDYDNKNYCVKILNSETGALLCALSGHSSLVRSVSWSPDGTKVASGSDDTTVRIWEVATGKELSQLRGHTDRVWSVCFSPDGKRLVSGSLDRTVMVWDPSTGEQLCQLRGHTDVVRSVCFSSDGKELTSGSDDSTVRNWDPATRASLS